MEKLKNILRGAKENRLTEAERSRIRYNLVAYMRENPARALPRSVPSPFSYLLFRPGVFAALFIAFVGVGTAGAAEGALPGDLLYPIKVSVNEPVTGAFQVSEEAQASWQVSLADRRLAEADELVMAEKFVEGRDARVAALVAEATAKAAEKVDEYSKKDSEKAAKAAAKLEKALAARGEALRTLESKGTASSSPVLRAAADAVGARAKKAEVRQAKVAAPEAAAFSLEMGGAGDASMPEEEEDEDDEKFDTKEYERASKLFERTRELAKEDRDRSERDRDNEDD